MATDAKSSEKLELLQHKGDKYTRLIFLEKKKLAELVEAIRYVDEQTDKFRSDAKKAAIDVMNLNILTPNPAYSKADGADIGKQANQVTYKSMVVLEAKLNSYLQRKSSKIKDNNALKTDIDHMRRMRKQTDLSHRNFETQLRTLKEKIAEIMSDSSAVVEQRERVVEAIKTLERQNAEEQAQFESDFDEMGRFIQEQNSNLEAALLRDRKEHLKDDIERSKPRDPAEIQDEVRMAGRVGELNSFVASETSSSENIKNTIVKYEKMFEQLKKITGSDSLEDVISTYSVLEEEMFSLYSYIQTQNAEIESVLEADLKIKEDIKQYSRQQELEDAQRMKALHKQQKRLEATKASFRKCEEAVRLNQEAAHEISKKIQNLFFKLQCDQVEGSSKTGANNTKGGNAKQNASNNNRNDAKLAALTGQGVTDSNVLDYLGAVENRAVDIIADYIRLMGTISNEPPRAATPGPVSPSRWPLDPFVPPPDLHEDMIINAVDADESDRIIDLRNFKHKLTKRLSNLSGSMTGKY
jgi:chromosome segregation ATPase